MPLDSLERGCANSFSQAPQHPGQWQGRDGQTYSTCEKSMQLADCPGHAVGLGMEARPISARHTMPPAWTPS